MKKFYASVWGMLSATLLFAQQFCPNGTPAVRHITYQNGVCAVYVDKMIPNAPVTLFGPGLTVIPTVSGNLVTTDASGYACFVYPCGQFPLRVSTCSQSGCCSVLIPAAAPLPVKLTTFSGRMQQNGAVLLNWASDFELESYKYSIERSTDGYTYTEIGNLAAAGSSYKSISYSFTDNNFSGVAFYRLKMIDIDGRSELSKVVYVNSKGTGGKILKVFPNPFRSDVQLIGINTADINAGTIRVFNTTGQQVPYRMTGSNAITISEAAPAGVYIVRFKEQVFKLVKE